MSWRGSPDNRTFLGRQLMIFLTNVGSGRWSVVCQSAAIDTFISAETVDEAERAALAVVSDRMLWLMRGWVRDLKITTKQLEDVLNDSNPSTEC